MKTICTKFAQSPKQCALLRECMKTHNQPEDHVLVIKKHVKTRWSSFKDALQRILETKVVLQRFFSDYGNKEEKEYFSSRNILMLELLLFLVSLINTYLIQLQGEDMDVVTVVRTLKEFIVCISLYKYKLSDEAKIGLQ